VTTPAIRPFTGRDKWGHVAMYAALSGLGLLLAWGAWAVDHENTFLRVLVLYTLVGVALTAILAVALAFTGRLSTLREETFEGRPARVLQSWAGEWWHTIALDAALATGAFVLAGLGIRQGADLLWPGVVVGIVGLWWLVRIILSATGRRHREGLRLTADELVLESGEGRLRCPPGAVTGVTTREDWGVVVGIRDGAVIKHCPWPWRSRSRRLGEHIGVVDVGMTAHSNADVAHWLAGELALDAPTDSARR